MAALTLARPLLMPRHTQANGQPHHEQEPGLIDRGLQLGEDALKAIGTVAAVFKGREMWHGLQDHFFPQRAPYEAYRQPLRDVYIEAVLDADMDTKSVLNNLGTEQKFEQYITCYRNLKVKLSYYLAGLWSI